MSFPEMDHSMDPELINTRLEPVRVEPFKVGPPTCPITQLPTESVHDSVQFTGRERSPIGEQLSKPEQLGQLPGVIAPIAPDCTKPNVLREALAMVEGPRAEAYGPPELNWARTSRIAIALTELDCLTPEVCVKVATAMKWARLLQTPNHHDTLVDIPGYGWVLSRVVEK